MNEHVRNAIDHLREGVQVIGFDWRYLYLNDTAVAHGQRQVEDLIGRRMPECYPGIEATPMFAALDRVMESRQPEVMRNCFEYPDGSQRWFDLRIDPVPAGICVLSIDVTEDQRTRERLRSVENQLFQAQKLESIGRLAGGVAHDFNNQLTIILGLAQMLLESDDLDEDRRRDLLEIEAAAKRSASITRQLLAFSRRQVMQVTSVLLPDVVRDVHRMLSRLIRANIRLELLLDPATEPIAADVNHLENVLANLTVNASDAMPDGGRLTITTHTVELSEQDTQQHAAMKSGRYSVLSLTDTGIGMDETTRAQIFEPFFTTKDKGKGTGLGLATVYGVVKQMDGFIWVYSELGRGTTFRLYFPVQDCYLLADADEPVATSPTAVGAPILVVEDDERVREFVVRALRSEGHDVTAAASAEEAEQHLTTPGALFSLLLCDVVLPGTSGPAFVQRAELEGVPVIFMSGYSALHVERRAAGRCLLLEKPFTKRDLLRAVRDLQPS